MERFEGLGAECLALYYKNGKHGRIETGSNDDLFDTHIPSWLTKPCTYTLPEPKWIICSAGEALDSVKAKRAAQVSICNGEWNDLLQKSPTLVEMLAITRKYRREA